VRFAPAGSRTPAAIKRRKSDVVIFHDDGAVRDVIRNCIYAVDRNPLAVDLCKVALWIEGYGAGLPLSFLDAHVKCGDSLVGVADLGLLTRGIPDEAYAASTALEKEAAKYLRQRNRRERETGQSSMDTYADTRSRLASTLVEGFSLIGIIVLNFVFTFSIHNISKLGHIGGFVAGGLAALAIAGTPWVRTRFSLQTQLAGLGGVAVLVVALVAARTAVFPSFG